MRHKGFWLVLIFFVGFSTPTHAQDLIQLYQEAHFKEKAAQIFAEHGMRVDPKPIILYNLDSELIRSYLNLVHPSPVVKPKSEPRPRYTVNSWRAARRLDKEWFEKRFSEVKWAFLGYQKLGILDTTQTRVLRGRLEEVFGAPTSATIDDLKPGHGRIEDYVQFEYWIVVNDSIPIKVLDVNGPFDRGLVFAGDRAHLDVLYDVKDALAELIGPGKPIAPYVDYYYDVAERIWYRTGYRNRAFFLHRLPHGPTAYYRPSLEFVP
jgi:hypothetical protein